MANTILQVKKSGVTGNVPSSLNYGELALNYADGRLYYKNSSGAIVYISSSSSSIGSFATVNANSSLILATSSTDTLTLVPGNNITISSNTSSKTITIGATDIVDQFARSSANAAYSAANNVANTVAVYVTSNITNFVAGSDISVDVNMANTNYPGGLFTIFQRPPIVFTVSDVWESSSSATKNAYSNAAASIINTSNVSLTLALTQATFSVQSSDTITIGGSVITGANLTSLGISGTGGTYNIPSAFISSAVQTNASDTVSVSLTTSRGVSTNTGTTLVNTPATPFNVSFSAGAFGSSTVPYFNLNQTFSWSASATGTPSTGTVTYAPTAGGSPVTLTTTGATSGTSGSIQSNVAYTITSTNTDGYYGAGLNGAGNRTIPSTITRSVSAATVYYPLFYKVTGSSSNPSLTTSDSYVTSNYTLGQGATTTATTTDYLWIGIPGSSSHTFAFTFLGTQVSVTPDASYTSQTIGGYTYNVYGFTNFNSATQIYTTS